MDVQSKMRGSVLRNQVAPWLRGLFTCLEKVPPNGAQNALNDVRRILVTSVVSKPNE